MKPLANHPSYHSVVKSTKAYLLLLSGGIALFVLILLLQLFAYFSQSAHAGSHMSDNTPSRAPKNTPIAAAAVLLTTTTAPKEAIKHEEIPAPYNAIAAPEKDVLVAAALKTAAKHASIVKAEKAFLKQNDARNEDVIKELAEVVDMHEFHFKKSSSRLVAQNSTEKFDSAVQKCIEAPESWSKIIILGFTDNRGSKLANVKLGMKRALMLKQILVKKGISAEKITVASFGPELPIATNSTEAGRSTNRRVEFNLVGTGS